MNKHDNINTNDEFYTAILSLKDLDECKRFMSDLCTVPELLAMEQRYNVAVCLSEGMVYKDILQQTGASSATISRVNRSLQYGANGYKDVFTRMYGGFRKNRKTEIIDDIEK